MVLKKFRSDCSIHALTGRSFQAWKVYRMSETVSIYIYCGRSIMNAILSSKPGSVQNVGNRLNIYLLRKINYECHPQLQVAKDVCDHHRYAYSLELNGSHVTRKPMHESCIIVMLRNIYPALQLTYYTFNAKKTLACKKPGSL
ncbi:hypothetical protein V6N13_103513 [Hibiscus sabdariffa]|uniref:Uncharacterized protein n=2 Tax=Hibiscus sabdariffa TaxID=183260 RepID=A0ABR2NGU8_9ROSI